MAERKKTPDLLTELLVEKGESSEKKPEKHAKPATRRRRNESKRTTAKSPKSPAELLLKPAEEVEAPPAELEVGELNSYVSFSLGNRFFALSLKYVDRAVRMVSITPVPDTPIWMAGVINLHGKVIPVLNLRRRLGLSDRQAVVDDHILIIQAQGQSMGVMVDQVTEVLEVPQHQMETASTSLSRTLPTEAVIRRNGDLILALDVTWLLQTEGELETIENLSEILAAENQTSQDASQIKKLNEDDLTQINGIGEIYARRLKEAGVYSFAALAKSDPNGIADLLHLSGKRKLQVQNWIKQAAARLVKNTRLASP